MSGTVMGTSYVISSSVGNMSAHFKNKGNNSKN